MLCHVGVHSVLIKYDMRRQRLYVGMGTVPHDDSMFGIVSTSAPEGI